MTEPRAIGNGPSRRPELAGGARWYVVHSAPRKELFAAEQLVNQGFRPFVPRFRRTVRHARQTRTVLTALFPRYLFVALDLQRDRWRSILGTFGVSHMIMAGERPKAVPTGVVEGLADAVDDGGAIGFRDRLQVGQEVRFATGPFAELVGRLVTLDERGRVGVLLEILGSERVVAATPGSLMPATS